MLAFIFRLTCALPLAAQLFFLAIAARAAFPREVAALPRGDPARAAAADLVGRLLAALDRMTLVCSAAAVIAAVLLSRRGVQRAAVAALPPLIAGVLAGISAALVTPAIHALRLSGQTSTQAF